jgi:hypothetical protein
VECRRCSGTVPAESRSVPIGFQLGGSWDARGRDSAGTWLSPSGRCHSLCPASPAPDPASDAVRLSARLLGSCEYHGSRSPFPMMRRAVTSFGTSPLVSERHPRASHGTVEGRDQMRQRLSESNMNRAPTSNIAAALTRTFTRLQPRMSWTHRDLSRLRRWKNACTRRAKTHSRMPTTTSNPPSTTYALSHQLM